MECIEARALKSSFYSETAMMKPTQQVFLDDLWCVTGINSVTCDDFSVDDLLDLPDNDFKTGSFEEEYSQDEEEEKDRTDDVNSNSSASLSTGDLGSVPAGELSVPVDDLENLEWLSQFVDDSVSELSLLCPAGNFKGKTWNRSEPVTRPAAREYTVLRLSSPVPTKARTKRSRASSGVWSIGSLSLTESSSTSSSSFESSLTSPFVFTNPVQVFDSFFAFKKPPVKKQKRNPVWETGSESGGFQTQRRCSHCHVQKTPQWRTGPLGPKTLCNACGVRFKSGRLFPEYRPACSPTFSGDVHSNSHRKVLEMRRNKETVEPAMPGLTPMVPGF
ncbi:hypothetical protein RJ640_017132 [Escallonia rubra]|uniref:GATA transcription factor n=1 Tax=Escallonia rubra TaxID=112253 RepID=A0AA88RFY8_9ASTE|nr:hypothetical protein RJ640_017132 [Escallonia rubra]